VFRDDVAVVTDYLDGRELISNIYLPRHLPITFDDGRSVAARVYVADITHTQFVGQWPDDKKVAAVKHGIGSEGRSLEYLSSLVSQLGKIGIEDTRLNALLRAAANAC
jgi:glutathione-specific gamma-glutamylcyclotransferase